MEETRRREVVGARGKRPGGWRRVCAPPVAAAHGEHRGRLKGCGRCSRAVVGMDARHLHALDIIRLVRKRGVEEPYRRLRGVAIHIALGCHRKFHHSGGKDI